MFPQIFGKYVLDREIAAGGMAKVYLATLRGADGFEKRLVVKQVRPELATDDKFVERFVEEAKVAVGLSHPNIVPVYELGVESGVYYIAMELCPGVTLARLISAGRLDEDVVAYVGVEVCRALDYAHRKAHIVHRDVTPRNVMIDDEGVVRLIDFGIAAPAMMQDEPLRVSGVFGSPGHMPPEQYHEGPLTPATDVFALATVLYEAWTAQPAFRRGTAAESRLALESEPPPLSAASSRLARLDELMAAALAHEPSQRPETAEAFARPLRRFLREADLGEVARRLGARVREAEAELRRRDAIEARGALGTSGQGLATPAHPGAATCTFAQHGEMREWTRRISSLPPRRAESSTGNLSTGHFGTAGGIDAPSTRRMLRHSDPPPDLEAGVGSGEAEAHTAFTPQVLEAAEASTVISGASSAFSGSPELAAAPDPGATPETASLKVPPSPNDRSASRRAAALATAGALALLGGWLLTRPTAKPPDITDVALATVSSNLEQPSPDAAARAGSRAASAVAKTTGSPLEPAEIPRLDASLSTLSASARSAAARSEATPAVRAPRPHSPQDARVPPAPERSAAQAAPASASPSASGRLETTRLDAEWASLTLTAAPTAAVSFRNTTQPTPVLDLQVPAGTYPVSFRHEALGEQVQISVRLKAGEKKRVHADFTAATPRVIVR